MGIFNLKIHHSKECIWIAATQNKFAKPQLQIPNMYFRKGIKKF
jgi:hypothetical protein